MTGAAGVHDVSAALRAVAGVAGVSVNLAAGQATVQFAAAGSAPRPRVAELSAALAAAGYSVPPARAVYPVSGMTCAACVHHVTGAIGAVPGVSGVSVNLASATAAVTHLPGAVAPDALAAAVADAGYHLDTVNIADHDADAAAARRNPRAAEEKQLRIRLLVAMLAAFALLLGSFPALPWTPALLSLWWYPLALWAVATPRAAVGRMALLHRRLGRTAPPPAQYAHPDCPGHLGRLRIQRSHRHPDPAGPGFAPARRAAL